MDEILETNKKDVAGVFSAVAPYLRMKSSWLRRSRRGASAKMLESRAPAARKLRRRARVKAIKQAMLPTRQAHRRADPPCFKGTPATSAGETLQAV